MTLRGNVFVQGTTQANHYKIWAMYNDEAPGNHNVTFDLTAEYNTVIAMPGSSFSIVCLFVRPPPLICSH
jgi:hypothetical protein